MKLTALALSILAMCNRFVQLVRFLLEWRNDYEKMYRIAVDF